MHFPHSAKLLLVVLLTVLAVEAHRGFGGRGFRGRGFGGRGFGYGIGGIGLGLGIGYGNMFKYI